MLPVTKSQAEIICCFASGLGGGNCEAVIININHPTTECSEAFQVPSQCAPFRIKFEFCLLDTFLILMLTEPLFLLLPMILKALLIIWLTTSSVALRSLSIQITGQNPILQGALEVTS